MLQAEKEALAVKARASSWQQAELVVSEGREKPSQAAGSAVYLGRLLVGVMAALDAWAVWR